MSEAPQAEEERKIPQSYGWCAWHRGHSHGIRLIDAIEQASGPGVALFACEPCRTANALVPLADRS